MCLAVPPCATPVAAGMAAEKVAPAATGSNPSGQVVWPSALAPERSRSRREEQQCLMGWLGSRTLTERCISEVRKPF
ncbi:uncharacterized protein METZ01_LOCUS235376 [marine metagenome]|uniref:Uncharacterized protein n=1 Tax=marine metagenome TaxID=408172 RepID=A0A382H5R1_9ZZZZ